MREKIAIFMLGLPGSGKTTWIKNNVRLYESITDSETYFRFVSADEIRLKHPDYDPQNPEAIHEDCVRIAEQYMYQYAAGQYNIVMDGGGINNNYTVRIITHLKNDGYKIKVVFINTPTQICLDRNVNRRQSNERFVPASSIIDKAYRLRNSVSKLKELCHEFVEVDYFTNNHIFCDMDGTVAEYQNLPCDEFGDVNFVGYNVFRQAKPVNEIIDKLKKLSKIGKNIYILSASPNNIANAEKIEWLQEHMPFIKNENIFFVGNKDYKHTFLRHVLAKLKIDNKDCMVLDDDHKILERERLMLVNAVHPSKFLTDF